MPSTFTKEYSSNCIFLQNMKLNSCVLHKSGVLRTIVTHALTESEASQPPPEPLSPQLRGLLSAPVTRYPGYYSRGHSPS